MIRADVINCMGVSPVYFLKLRMNQLVLIPFEYAYSLTLISRLYEELK